MCVQMISIIQNLFDIKMRTKVVTLGNQDPFNRPLFTQRNDDVIVGRTYVSEIPAETERLLVPLHLTSDQLCRE